MRLGRNGPGINEIIAGQLSKEEFCKKYLDKDSVENLEAAHVICVEAYKATLPKKNKVPKVPKAPKIEAPLETPKEAPSE